MHLDNTGLGCQTQIEWEKESWTEGLKRSKPTSMHPVFGSGNKKNPLHGVIPYVIPWPGRRGWPSWRVKFLCLPESSWMITRANCSENIHPSVVLQVVSLIRKWVSYLGSTTFADTWVKPGKKNGSKPSTKNILTLYTQDDVTSATLYYCSW